jgi:hypothetical protein
MENNRKKVALAVLFIFIFTNGVLAQRAFEIGIKGGINLAQLKTGKFVTTPLKDGQPWSYNGQILKDNLKQSYDTRQGFVFGAYTRFGRKLFLQPELLVATKGGTIDLTKVDPAQLTPTSPTDASVTGTPTLTQAIRVSYTNIDIPVLVGYKILGFGRVVAGPVASLNMGSNQKLAEALKYYANNNISDSFNKAIFGYQLGAGVNLGNIGLDVRHEASISEITAIKIGDQSFAPKQKSWLVTLSYRII